MSPRDACRPDRIGLCPFRCWFSGWVISDGSSPHASHFVTGAEYCVRGCGRRNPKYDSIKRRQDRVLNSYLEGDRS